jgi:hypothetical protein
MSNDQMNELAARLRTLADALDWFDGNGRKYAPDARSAADLIESMAQRVPLSEEQIYQVIEAARESYRAHTTGIRGQMLTIYDDMDWHLARAIEQAVWEKNDD